MAMSPESLPESPGRDEFADLIRAMLVRAGEADEIAYDADEFQLRVEGEESHYGNLGNLYGEYMNADGPQRARLVRNYVRSWFARLKDVPDDFEDCQPDLLPSIRPRSFIELNLLQFVLQGAENPRWPYLPFGEHLALSLVYDLPESLVQIQGRHLDAWGVEFRQALERAVENLAAISDNEFDEVAPGLWRSPWQDNLDASRVVLPGLLLAHPIQGDPVVMVPNRDTLLLAGDEDEAALSSMIDLAEEAYDQPRSISGVALRLCDDHWEEYLPERGHPAYAPFRLLYLRSLGSDYANQKAILDESGDVYVAEFSAFEEESSGEVVSYCIWSDGIESLLPVTDRVFFVRVEGEDASVVSIARWDRVVESLGDMLGEQPGYPVRYRVSEFPDEEQLAELDERDRLA
jgi:uncharacterized protein YtpQ (UPF0354 family)